MGFYRFSKSMNCSLGAELAFGVQTTRSTPLASQEWMSVRCNVTWLDAKEASKREEHDMLTENRFWCVVQAVISLLAGHGGQQSPVSRRTLRATTRSTSRQEYLLGGGRRLLAGVLSAACAALLAFGASAAPVWSTPTSGAVDSSPAVANGASSTSAPMTAACTH